MIESFIAQSKAAYASSRMGHISGYTREGNHFIFRDLHAVLSVSAISPEIWRIRYAPHGSFLPDFSYAIQHYPFGETEVSIREDKDKYVLNTELVKLSIMKDGGEISFFDQKGLLTCADSAGASWEENQDHGG